MIKKNIKKIIVGIIMIALVVGYYSYLSNRPFNTEPSVTTNDELTKIISRNLDGVYYPEFPQSVIEFYSRIVQAYYYTELTDEEVKALGSQARMLFDDELLGKNPEDEFYDNLMLDIAEYNRLERKIYNYTIEDSEEIDIFTFDGNQYAVVTVGYLIREKSDVATIYQDYTLRKDKDGKWKILFWEQSVLTGQNE